MAPWCTILDNLELGILLLAQPWLAGGGLRRADLERQLTRLAADLPLAPVYFQRVKRSVTKLEEIGALQGLGSRRTRRFVTTPAGFGALLLNLRVLHSDPTLDGTEFELKLALVAMWNLVLERVEELPPELFGDAESDDFFAAVEQLEVLGERVIGDQVVREALDLLGLIELQRQRVESRLAETELRLQRLEHRSRELENVDLATLAERLHPGLGSALLEDAATSTMVRHLATGVLPATNLRANATRYRHYLAYLDELTRLYSRELTIVGLASLRRIVAGPRA